MFPQPIPLSEQTLRKRKERWQALTKTACYGIIIRFFIAIMELFGFFLFDSSVLLLDALSTFADVLSSIFLIVTIKIAEKPPDHNHPFGHGRLEPLAGLQLATFLLIGGIGMCWKEITALFSTTVHETIPPSAIFLPCIAIILLELGYRKMKAIASRENSPAIRSEANHFRLDSINSIFALIALCLTALFPAYSFFFDHSGAVIIATCMIYVGCVSAKNNIHQLIDRTPDKKYFDIVRCAAKKIEGVLDTEKIGIQIYGPDAHVDIDIEVDPKLTVDIAHAISQQVRSSIQEAWPQVREVIVHIEPFYANDHNVTSL